MPKKKPTALRLLEGNPGKRAINRDEPVPENNLADAPAFLDGLAKEMWAYVLAETPPGLIKTTDVAELLTWCVAFQLYKEAYEKVREQGAVVLCPVKGAPMPNPYIRILNQQAEILTRSGSNLGLNPAARSKISIANGGPKKPSTFAGFKKGDK